MKRWLICLLIPAASSLWAQKEDNVWVFGYRYTFETLANGIYFEFGDSLNISYSQKPMSLMDTYGSICDSNGDLLLLSNGCYIEKANGETVENSEGLNPGILANQQCFGNAFGYNVSQSMIMLPDPSNFSRYHLFHYPLVIEGQHFLLRNLLHTVVDMSANNGQGSVVIKNQIVVNDTIDTHGLHAVRHGNGRDWWIVCPKLLSNTFYMLLLTPDSIISKTQQIGPPLTQIDYGEITFSPDGSKMAVFDAQNDLRLFDFDRCSGTLSNPQHITITNNADNEIAAGLAFSADGRYLYCAEVKRLLQFDMLAPDVAASQTLVAERILNPDCPLGQSLMFMELAPDGRIYCRPGNGQQCMHRLARPELPGPAAQLEQYYYTFDVSYKNLPHFPNFRLGPLDGSPCDTLGLDNHPLANWRYDRTGGLGVDFTSVSWYEPSLWQWDFGDPASGAANNSAERNPAHTFSAPGAYEVCLTVSNDHGSDTKCKTVWLLSTGLPLSIGEGGRGVRLYPNPTSGMLSWSGFQPDEPVSVQVFNTLGQICINRGADSQNTIDLSGLPNGYYRIRLCADREPPVVRTVLLTR